MTLKKRRPKERNEFSTLQGSEASFNDSLGEEKTETVS